MASDPKSSATQPTDEDYARLGRAVESIAIKDYVDLLTSTKRQLVSSFLRGMAAGLGGIIGATVVVALVVWILHMLGGVPYIGHSLKTTSQQIQTTK